jgi:hypothetical protein
MTTSHLPSAVHFSPGGYTIQSHTPVPNSNRVLSAKNAMLASVFQFFYLNLTICPSSKRYGKRYENFQFSYQGITYAFSLCFLFRSGLRNHNETCRESAILREGCMKNAKPLLRRYLSTQLSSCSSIIYALGWTLVCRSGPAPELTILWGIPAGTRTICPAVTFSVVSPSV